MKGLSLSAQERPRYMIVSVSAIIERGIEGETAIYVQTRWKPTGGFAGTFEIPGGKIEAGEDIFTALKREVREETGLEITKIKPSTNTTVKGCNELDCTAFTPFCGNAFSGSNVIGFIFRCEAEGDIDNSRVNEAMNPRWIKISELKKILEETPESVFPYYLGALKYYLEQKEKGLIV
jgi:8-oxo-dGTP pyrophosphatase MutT (NUDIX family)